MISFSHQWGNAEPYLTNYPARGYKSPDSKRTRAGSETGQILRKGTNGLRVRVYVWSDTCYNNKESSTEVDEAILSMGAWLSEAGIYTVHLVNSSSFEDFLSESWCTRVGLYKN